MTASPTPASKLFAARDTIGQATALAWQWQGAQTRKGRVTSYMSHLTGVHAIVIQAGGGPNEAIAALLHDGLEDAPDSRERAAREKTIGSEFGSEVLQIVLDCTDTRPGESVDDKDPWRKRKERYLEQLAAAAPPSRLVAACDKRQNLGDLVSDLRHEGPKTLARFNAGAEEQVWYFESMAKICRGDIPARLAQELDDLVAELKALVAP
jgi:(p)ppGpp synthase/HD superfamily hydrolase